MDMPLGMQIKLLAILSILLIALVIWRSLSNRANAADSGLCFDDLLLGEDGKMSKSAAVMMGSFAMTTWMMIYLVLNDKMTEGYFTIYVAAWITPVVVRIIRAEVGKRGEESVGE